jgi:pimeloyl-ACP methyl ester carboxylesterase
VWNGNDATVTDFKWDLIKSGSPDAESTVLLLPGGLCGAGTYKEVMNEEALAGVQLVAATLPGHAGAPPLEDSSVESMARAATELAEEVRADAIVGFSMGASVAYQMVVSGLSKKPAVLLGISLSAKDEASFFLALFRGKKFLGNMPAKMMAKGAAAMAKRSSLSEDRRRELQEEFARNVPAEITPSLREYVAWLERQTDPDRRLCQSAVPVWLVHAEKGDGGITDSERQVLNECPSAHIVTIPGKLMLLPTEAPAPVARSIAAALGKTQPIT